MAILGAKTYQNYIAGEWVDAASGETFESSSPADGETIGVFPRSGAEDVGRAVAAAKEAYEDWRLVPAPKRGEILFRFAQLLAENKEELAQLMAHEMGKVLPEARGDVQEAVDMAYYMGGEGRRLFGQTTPSELRDKFNMSVRQPIGVVGVITPWNFPIAIPSWKTLPALVAGNTVVFKPATDTPTLGERYVEILVEAGVPSGVVNIVHGGGGEVGNALVQHPDVPVISLTGSRETGVAVLKAAADGLKHVHLELGGKNAIIVLDDADLDLAVDGIVWSAFGTSGQRCTAASRVIVQRGIYEELQSKLVAAAEGLHLGVGWDEETDVGPVIDEDARDRILEWIDEARSGGAEILTGGELEGDLVRPTVIANAAPDLKVSCQEVFGPVVTVNRYGTLDEALDLANGTEFGLQAGIFTGSIRTAMKAAQELEFGGVTVNEAPTFRADQMPYGGVKESGNTKEGPAYAVRELTDERLVVIDL